MTLTKVEKYLRYKRLRDSLPGNDVRRKHFRMRREYEELSFKMVMTKPTERDYQEFTFEMLKRQR